MLLFDTICDFSIRWLNAYEPKPQFTAIFKPIEDKPSPLYKCIILFCPAGRRGTESRKQDTERLADKLTSWPAQRGSCLQSGPGQSGGGECSSNTALITEVTVAAALWKVNCVIFAFLVSIKCFETIPGIHHHLNVPSLATFRVNNNLFSKTPKLFCQVPSYRSSRCSQN